MKRFVISAAGLGSRLGKDLPKCLIPVGDACLIDFQMALLPAGSDVRIVVGFREEEVMAHVNRRWPDVTFVRNPAFATTSNTYSLMLAAQHIPGPFVALDGDLIIDSGSFRTFLDRCDTSETALVGVVPIASQEAIGARLENGMVTSFLRPGAEGYAGCTYEWCGIAYIRGFSIHANPRFVFEELAEHLPLPGIEIKCVEIDTPRDHEAALAAIREGLIQLPPLPPA